MTHKIQWIRLKYPPDPSTVLTPIQENGKEFSGGTFRLTEIE